MMMERWSCFFSKENVADRSAQKLSARISFSLNIFLDAIGPGVCDIDCTIGSHGYVVPQDSFVFCVARIESGLNCTLSIQLDDGCSHIVRLIAAVHDEDFALFGDRNAVGATYLVAFPFADVLTFVIEELEASIRPIRDVNPIVGTGGDTVG